MLWQLLARSICGMAVTLSGSALAAVAEAPPLKPGLWAITTERSVNGQAAPAGMERLQRLNGSVVADGESTFINAESCQVGISSTMQAMGRTTQSTNQMSAKWLAADCGNVKPLEPRAAAGAPER